MLLSSLLRPRGLAAGGSLLAAAAAAAVTVSAGDHASKCHPGHSHSNGHSHGECALGQPQRVAVVGATGAVGLEIVDVLKRRGFPLEDLKLYASKRSAGKTIDTSMGPYVIEEFNVEKVRANSDVVFLAVSGSFALKYASQLANDGGPLVIDNSSAFRYMPEVPLVVPEVNGDTARQHLRQKNARRIIANPNCTTAIAAMALWPLHQHFGITDLIVSTYQAASGAGIEGIEELREGAREVVAGQQPSPPTVFAHPLPFNVIPHIDKFQDNGYTKEEMKVAWETCKIFGVHPDSLRVSTTAVRVPTFRAHAEAITLKTALPINPTVARDILRRAPGVQVVDDVAKAEYPMPLNSTSRDDVNVGRIRQSLVFGDRGLDIFVCGDQLLRGAALNAVLIAEHVLK